MMSMSSTDDIGRTCLDRFLVTMCILNIIDSSAITRTALMVREIEEAMRRQGLIL